MHTQNQLPQWLSRKESTCNAGVTGDVSLILGSGRFPRGGHGNPLQFSCLEKRTKRPGRLQSIGWQRVGHDLATEHSAPRQSHHLYFNEAKYVSYDILRFHALSLHL